MGVKTTYICDNCLIESSKPEVEKWFSVERKDISKTISITAFKKESKFYNCFCGEACVVDFISTKLASLFIKEEALSATLDKATDETKLDSSYAVNLKEFLNG